MQLLNVHELAAICGVKAGTIRRWFSQGVLPQPLRLGGRLRWERGTIENWIRGGCQPVALEPEHGEQEHVSTK